MRIGRSAECSQSGRRLECFDRDFSLAKGRSFRFHTVGEVNACRLPQVPGTVRRASVAGRCHLKLLSLFDDIVVTV
jgi:hypothetical protein